MKRFVAVALTPLALLNAGTAAAEFGIGVKGSTLGAGVELGVQLTETVNARVGLNQYTMGDDQTIDGIAYSADLDLQSTAAYLDWHPFGGGFHLTAGYVNSNNELSGTATPVGTVNIGGTDYDGSTLDFTLNALVEIGSGPYLGFGWGNVPAKGLGLTVEVGAIQSGAPDASLVATGADAGVISDADLRQEEANMQADLDEYELYPVIAVGLSYGF